MSDGGNNEALPVSELREDAELRSNLFSGHLKGSGSISRIFDILTSLCGPQSVTRHQRVGGRDFITSKSSLGKGQPIAIETVCLRDEEGWIYAASLHIEPLFAAGSLASQLAEILRGGASGRA